MFTNRSRREFKAKEAIFVCLFVSKQRGISFLWLALKPALIKKIK